MKRIALAMSMLGLSVSLPAADLASIYSQAKQHDPQIQAAAATREAGKEARPQAMAQLLPNISLSGDLSYNVQDIHSSPSGSSDQDYASNNLGLRVVQPLFRKDRLIGLEQADIQVSRADADYQVAEQALILRVAQAYFNVLSAHDSLTFAQSEKRAIERQLDQAKERFEVGLVAITDVHEAQARFDQARASVISAENGVDNALEALREIVPDAANDLDKMQQQVPLAPPKPANIEQWSDTAQQNNPVILSTRLATELARKTIELRDAGDSPSLDLVGTLNRARSDSPFGSDVDAGTIGIQLSVPLYTGGAVNSATRQARFEYEAAQQGLDQTRRQVSRQVRDAYRGIHSSISRVKALQATVLSAQSALEAVEAGFEAGTRTLVDVLNSQRDLFGAKRDYAQARYDYVLSTLSLFQAAGTLSEQDLQEVNTWLQ